RGPGRDPAGALCPARAPRRGRALAAFTARQRSSYTRTRVVNPSEASMCDTKERLSLLWIFALLNYLYADVIALWALLGAPPADTPHLGQLALAGSAVLMEIPIAMIVASRLLPLRARSEEHTSELQSRFDLVC